MSSSANQNANTATSISGANILSQFESMMSELVAASDAVARRAAEKQLLELKNTNLLLYLECLLQLMLRSKQSDVKQLCMVMFRRSCEPNNTSKEQWQQIPDSAYAAFQKGLLSALCSETELSTYLLVCDAIGTLASRLIPDGKWNNLLAQMLDLVNASTTSASASSSSASFHKQGFLRVLDCLAEYAITHMQAQFGNIYQVIEAGLHDSSTDIAVAAYKAFVSMVISIQDDDTTPLKQWQPLIPTCLKLLAIEREQVLCKVLATTIDLVSHRLSSLFTEPDMNALLASVFKVAGNDALDFETRKLAFEMLVVMATRNAAVLRVHQQFVTNVVQLCLHFLALFDDEVDFADSESDMDQVYVWNGRHWLAQLTKSLGAKAVLCESQSMLQNGLQSVDTNWTRCYATLTALTEIAPFIKERNDCDAVWKLTTESSSSASSSSSECVWHHIVPQILRFTTNKQLKTAPIKFAALELVKTLLIEFSGSFRHRFHVEFYQSMMQILSEYKSYHPRVTEECVKCMAHFHRADLDDDDDRGLLTHNLQAFANSILGALQRMIGDASLNEGLRAQCATCVGTLAECMQDKFLPYYEKFMPAMMSVIEKESTKAIFRGKALECLGMMGEAVGRVRFARDVDKLMPWLLALRTRLKQREETNAADNVAYNYVNQLFARISRCMRDAFVPYLPQVMTLILASARMEAANILTPEQASPADARFSVFTVHVRGVGDVKFCINPISLEEKQTACHMLYQLAKDQCVAFAPFVLETARSMKQLMRYQYNARIRAAATTIMPLLMKSVIKAIGAQTIAPDERAQYHALLAELFEPFMVALQFEPDVTEQIPILEILAQISSVIEQSGGFWTWTDAQLQRIASVLAQIVSESQERCQQRKQTLAPDDDDVEWANDVDAELIAHVIDVIEYTFKVSGERFTPFLHSTVAAASSNDDQKHNKKEENQNNNMTVTKVAQSMLTSTDNLHRLHALCVFVDIIEYGGKTAADLFLQWLWPIVCKLVTDNDTDLQQTAIYAIGMLAQKQYLQHLDGDYEWLHCFVQQVVKTQLQQNKAADNANDEDAEDYDDDQLLLFENKLSAIGKILRYQPPTNMAPQTLSDILQQWVQLLPVEHDEEEIDNAIDNLLFFMTQFWTLLVENDADMRQHIVYCCLYCLALFKQRLTSYELVMDYDIDFKSNGKTQKIPVLSRETIQKIKELKQHTLLTNVFDAVLSKLTPKQRQNIQFVLTNY